MKWEDLKPKKKGGGGKTPPFATRDSKLLIFNDGDGNGGANNEGYTDVGTEKGTNKDVFLKDGLYYIKNDDNDYVLFNGWLIPSGANSTPIYIQDGQPEQGENTGPQNGSDSKPIQGTPPPTPSYVIWGTGLTGTPDIYATSLTNTTGLFTGSNTSNTYTGLALKTGDSQTVYVVINGAVQGTSYTVNNLNDLSKQLATDESNMQTAIANAQATAQAEEKSAQQSVNSANATIKSDQTTITNDEEELKAEETANQTLSTENSSLAQQLKTANQTIASDEATINTDNTTIAKDKQALVQANKTIQANEQELVNLNQSLTAQKNFTNNLINSKDKQIKTLQTQNQAFSQALSGSPGHEAIAPGNTETNPVPLMNTILSVAEFQKFTTNYYLSQTGTNGYFANSTLKRMQSIISNVELNLNAMLNGRLYEKYPPGAVVFRGYGSLTPQVEEQTLYQCLTECVEYRLITQQYVNLNNSYSGMVNGTNNYQTQNNNVIGLRQDIQAKLSLLGLYANVLLGKKVPKSTEYQDEHDGHLTINFSNLQQWYGFIQNTAWNFTKPISFQGGMTFAGNVLFTADSTFTGNISTKGTITSNGLTVNGPLNALSCDLTGGSLSNVSLGSFQNINVANASNLHNVTLSGTDTMPSTVSSSNTNWNLTGQNNTFNSTIPSTFQDLTVKGKFTYDSSAPTAFNNTVSLNTGDLNVNNGTINQTSTTPSATNSLGSTTINGTVSANTYEVPTLTWPQDLYDVQSQSLTDYLSNNTNMTDQWVLNSSETDLLNSVNSTHVRCLGSNGVGSFLMEQYAVEIYDTTSPELIPGYMSPIADGQAYINLQKLFLNTFGNGDLTNGYSYQFHCPMSALPEINFDTYYTISGEGLKNYPRLSTAVVESNFKVYSITGFGVDTTTYGQHWQGYRWLTSYYSGNPFPMGIVNTNAQSISATQLSTINVNITVPYAVDNRQADDSMFLKGALMVNFPQNNANSYVVCVFKVRYIVNVGGYGLVSPTTKTFTPSDKTEEVKVY